MFRRYNRMKWYCEKEKKLRRKKKMWCTARGSSYVRLFASTLSGGYAVKRR